MLVQSSNQCWAVFLTFFGENHWFQFLHYFERPWLILFILKKKLIKKILLVFLFMNKIILVCFQDDQFFFIFEPLVSKLLMIKFVFAWICACQWMHICLLFIADISPKRKIKIHNSSVSWMFSIANSYVWLLMRNQICRLLIKIL
jgi:hypothetical protein